MLIFYKDENDKVRCFNADKDTRKKQTYSSNPVQGSNRVQGTRSERTKSEGYRYIIYDLESAKVERKEFVKHDKQPTEDEIIKSIGGLDKTVGSCASLTLVYAANKAGYNVKDFRGGKSCEIFSQKTTYKDIARLKGVKADIYQDANDYNAVTHHLLNMKSNKEYILCLGSHGAVVRKQDSGYQYLELQDKPELNGWKKLTKGELKKRFKCKKTHSSYGMQLKSSSILIDVESLGKSDEFLDIVGYINTEEGKQQKGIGGYAK